MAMRIGVVVGRFQIDRLHTGHDWLLKHILERCDVLCVVLGCTDVKGSKRNPMEFVTRKQMLETWRRECTYRPEIPLVVLPQHDQKSDVVWSKNLDKLLLQTFPGCGICLYGGRDSFLPHYKGNLSTTQVAVEVQASATDRRQIIGAQSIDNADFRRGIIYSTYNQWPRVFQVVDVALHRGDKLFLGQRHADEGKLRFFGGFVDQDDADLETAAARELGEEARVSAQNLRYLGSYQVSDYRYKTHDDGVVMTAFFASECPSGQVPDAGDDIDEVVEVKWSKDYTKLVKRMVDSHQKMMYRLLSTLEKDRK